jgi:hypothetical protein
MKKAHSDFVAHREALRDAWNAEADGFLCKYTGIKVDERNPFSPWYISFDHPIPGKKGTLVVTVQLLNFMKKDLTAEELPVAVIELANKFEGGVFHKDAVKFRYWLRVPRPPFRAGPLETLIAGMGYSLCEICGGLAPAKGKYCPRCNRFILHHSDKAARAAALKRAWDPVRKGFACHYTDIILEEFDFHDPWYLTFDHPDPGDPTHLVVAAAWVNGMKTNLTEDEFRAVINELARHFRTGAPFNTDVVDFKYWTARLRMRIIARRRK